MSDELYLDNLPLEILLLIFNYCHAFDLVRISEVCRRFNEIIDDDILWFAKRNIPLATNQATRKFRDRCNRILSLRRRWHVSANWQSGKYKQTILHSWNLKAMPWIFLSNDTLWWTSGNQLCAFRRRRKRNEPYNNFTEAEKTFNRDSINSDISRFIVRDDYVISGHSDGSITFWSRSSIRDPRWDLRINNAHSSKVNAVAEISGVIISGSGDGTVKIWSSPGRAVVNEPIATVNVRDRIWSLAADSTNGKFAIGSAGHRAIPPLKILDIQYRRESISIVHTWRRGAGLLDMLWENPNTLLTCGYDTCLRKWDIRSGGCVASWVDPTDAALYCMSSDYHNTIVTGSQYNCKAVLWDQRMRNYVQLYFLNNVERQSSPLYSISFDSSNLYGTTDRRLVELTFSGYDYYQKDYRNIIRSAYPQLSPVNVIR